MPDGSACGICRPWRCLRGSMNFTISNSCGTIPNFSRLVADRIWDFTWKDKKAFRSATAWRRDCAADLIANQTFPFALMAHDGERYAGVGAGDRLRHGRASPLHAVGRGGLGRTRLPGSKPRAIPVNSAAERLLQTFPRVYLCARPARHDFYARQGWAPIERDVGEARLTIFTRQ